MGMFDIDDEGEDKKTENKKKVEKKKKDTDSTATTVVFYLCVTIIILAFIICSHINDMANIKLEEQKLVYNATQVEENTTEDAE